MSVAPHTADGRLGGDPCLPSRYRIPIAVVEEFPPELMTLVSAVLTLATHRPHTEWIQQTTLTNSSSPVLSVRNGYNKAPAGMYQTVDTCRFGKCQYDGHSRKIICIQKHIRYRGR